MVKIIFGAASLTDQGKFNTDEKREKVLDILAANNVSNLDTARLYAGSEQAIGKLDKRNNFTIDTKVVGGFNPGNVSRDQVVADVANSLETAGIKQFDILYIHAPDPTIPIEETLAGINDVYKKGSFRRFGLSNFSCAQVKEVHAICKEKGYVLPTMYQGNYSAVARHLETLLFPTLKELGLAFYAYSPIAGGFLTKSAADLDAGAGRFNQNAIGGLYSGLYDKPEMREALVKWNEIAQKEGVSTAELAYRWVAAHSAISKDDFVPGQENGVIIGASRHEQIEQTIGAIKKGKLSEEAVKGIEGIWESVKEVAPVDNYNKMNKL
ncbi:Aldo/keto reductase [Phaeosphaeriaceae sp. SRC1lsM3a]|nr:Aldo/keto reductase [Stagonospora sp. SRC1lsM3a]